MPEITGVKACVFDAYGTLFDVAAAAHRMSDKLGDKTEPLAVLWRTKQLEYTWVRSLMKAPYRDFWGLTADALDFALAALKIDEPNMRALLLNLYYELDAYPEAKSVLGALKAAGYKTAILSNGSVAMLDGAVSAAGLKGELDCVLSVDAVETYKTDPKVYQMAVDALEVSADEICFQSANPWDVSGAAHFGFQVVWINRTGQPPERLPGEPAAEISTLEELPPLLGV